MIYETKIKIKCTDTKMWDQLVPKKKQKVEIPAALWIGSSESKVPDLM
jgi:hypothetical protein